MLNELKKIPGLSRRAYLLSVHFLKIWYLKRKGAKIGEKTWILEDLTKQAAIEPQKLEIGSRCVICADTVILCGDAYNVLLKRDSELRGFDGVRIMDNCFIGVGAIIANGVCIGPNSIVGAGSAVFSDVKPNSCVAGNPARYVCDTDSYAKVSAAGLIEDYSELKNGKVSKSKFLMSHFWKNS